MTMPYGGLRDRFIEQSLRHMVRDALTDLGWFTPGTEEDPDSTRFNDYALALVGDADGEENYRLDPREPVIGNKLGIDFGVRTTSDAELGSDMEIHRWLVWFDMLTESQAVGKHLQGDLEAILRGVMPGTERADTGPSLPVHDWALDEPVIEFYCDIEDLGTDQPPSDINPNWFVISCDVVDTR